MVDVVLYTKSYCTFSKECKKFLDAKGVKYDEMTIDNDPIVRSEMETKSGRTDTPQVFIGGRHIGSFDDLKALEEQGLLDGMLNV